MKLMERYELLERTGLCRTEYVQENLLGTAGLMNPPCDLCLSTLIIVRK